MSLHSRSHRRSTLVAALVAGAAAASCAGRPDALGVAPVAPVDSATAAAEAQIAADVQWLAAPARGGRFTGTPQDDSVALYLTRRYQLLGLAGAFGTSSGTSSGTSYVQRFETDAGHASNVAAVVRGSDPALAREYVIVGAHRDHIGRVPYLAADPDLGAALHPGADDNASGTAAVLELARRLAARPARRSVLVVHFDAEELGLLGSRAFVAHAPVSRSAVRLMLNLDMVGRLRANRLYVEVRGGHPVAALVDSAARAAALRAEPTSEIDGRSDQTSFAGWRVPTVALFTGFHADYHRSSDVASRVNTPGIRRVVDAAEILVRAVADRQN